MGVEAKKELKRGLYQCRQIMLCLPILALDTLLHRQDEAIQKVTIPGNCGAGVQRVKSETREAGELSPGRDQVQDPEVSPVVGSVVVMVVGSEQAARGAGGPGGEVPGRGGHGGAHRPGVVDAHAAHEVVEAVARAHGQELSDGPL